jgi:endonuclease/exonuclease/phosphatase family metal-dependent hydrolase
MTVQKTKKPTLARTVVESIRNRRNRPTEHRAIERDPSRSLVVASYNVHKCVGNDGRFDPERILRVIREIDPDVIALQEADKRFGERAGLMDLPLLEHETGLRRVPLTTLAKSHGWRGNVMLFKQGMIGDVHQIALPGLEPRGAAVVEIDLDAGASLRVIAAHLGLLKSSRHQQADMIVELMKSRRERPTLLMGDFNEWRVGQGSSLHRFSSVFGPLPPPLPSFPARLPVLPLDRILANRQDLISSLTIHDTPLSRVASDHLPIKAEIALSALVG